MTGATIKLPMPHAGQRQVLKDSRRFNWLSAGRRWRKTTLVLQVAIEAAIKGGVYIWGAPTFDQVRVGWGETKRALGGVAEFNQSRMTATLPTGGQIIYRSLDDPDNARGHTANGLVIDEGGVVKESAWYEVLRPMLIDTGGWGWVIGTPNGRNWFWREWVAAKSREDSATWQIPTLGCQVVDGVLVRQPHPLENPDIPFSEIEHIFNTVPLATFRQEILAEFLEGEGTVFRNITANLIAPKTEPNHHIGHTIVAGLDWAKMKDYTAISVFCADCNQELAIDRFNQIDYHVQRQRLTVLVERWNVNRIEAEANSIGEPNIEELQRAGLPVFPFQTTATSKPPLIESLALAFEKQEAKWIDDPVWTGELEAYEMKLNANTGRPSYGAPPGLNDDTVIARALAWKAAFQPLATGEMVNDLDPSIYTSRKRGEKLWR